MFGLSFGARTPPKNEDWKPRPEETETEESLVSMVDREFIRREEERRPFELQWQLNVAFIEGNQYCDLNPATMSIEEIPKFYWWEEREVINQIAPIIETRNSKLSRMRPILKARPGSDEQSDIRAARVGSQLLKTIYYDNNVQSLMSECYAWMDACGTVLAKNIWNPTKGAIIAKMAMLDENGNPAGEEEIRGGDLEWVIVPAYEIYPDSSYHQDVEHCRSIIHAKAYHIDEIEENWGIRVSPESVQAIQLQKSMVGLGGIGYGNGGGYRFTRSQLKEHALVKEYWERPSKKYPRGRLLIIAGKKLLYKGDLPYPVGEDNTPAIPYTKLDCIKRPGCFWGRSITERLIPIQRRYNALRNRKTEYLNRCSIGQWLIETESVDLNLFEQQAGAPGAILEYNQARNMPKLVEMPPLPHAFETEEQTLLQEFSMISGVSELSRQSQAPPGVKSGVALSIALEQDDTRLASTAENVSNFLINNGRMWLRLYRAYAKGPRTLQVVGKNNVVEVMDWDASDIRSDDVIVEGFSALAESPAQRRQMVFDLLGTGLFNDPDTGQISKETRAKILEIIELGNWESADDKDEIHLSKAERENRKLSLLQPADPAPYDDHVLHISRHNQYRLTTEYEEMVTKNPLLELLFQAHVDSHLMLLAPAFARQTMPEQEQGGVQPRGTVEKPVGAEE